MTLKYRIAIIAALTLASLWALFPRSVAERVSRNGTFVYDTVRRVPLKRGLDLQGGIYLALDVDESRTAVANKSEAIDRALKVVRTRIDQFGVSEPVVQKAGSDRIIVELPGIDDPRRAQEVVQQSAFLQFQITDKTNALDKVLPRVDAAVREAGTSTAVRTADTAARAGGGLQSLFTTDTARKPAPDTGARRTAASDSAVPPGATTPGPFSKLLQQGQIPGEYMIRQADVPSIERYLALPAVTAALPPGKVLRLSGDSTQAANGAYRALYVLDARPIITGEYLTDAKPNSSPTEGTIVEFQLNNEGGRRFRSATARNIGNYMAIVLDDRVMGRPPVIQSAIGTRGQITMGGRDLQSAQDLALVLRAGALPVPLKVAEIRNIGASLGKDSIQKGIAAGLIAVALVVLIMIGYYRFAGLLAVGGLVLYIVYTLATLAGFGAVLTLPGIAGFVLSIGIAVDANVLIFERIREELDRGKSVRASVDEGFRHALPAIVDSNVATGLTAAVLYQYGTGPVRGFAVTLLAGIIASMVTAVFVVRTFYMVWLKRAGPAPTLSI